MIFREFDEEEYRRYTGRKRKEEAGEPAEKPAERMAKKLAEQAKAENERLRRILADMGCPNHASGSLHKKHQ